MTNAHMFDEGITVAVRTSSCLDKIDLMKKPIDLHCGDILMAGSALHLIMQDSSSCYLKYIICLISFLLRQNMLIFRNMRKIPDTLNWKICWRIIGRSLHTRN